ncbi:Uncharacterized protein APZ42_017243 [Daphnia magna]|uniref:Uncharacterized protein n=1 Tax=Daphnia magna TaxID=35525 RepID=A0A0P5U5U7_9CRUS|nr:Uncharacterized protein APZ42_017243 [Daphnia magna]
MEQVCCEAKGQTCARIAFHSDMFNNISGFQIIDGQPQTCFLREENAFFYITLCK